MDVIQKRTQVLHHLLWFRKGMWIEALENEAVTVAIRNEIGIVNQSVPMRRYIEDFRVRERAGDFQGVRHRHRKRIQPFAKPISNGKVPSRGFRLHRHVQRGSLGFCLK